MTPAIIFAAVSVLFAVAEFFIFNSMTIIIIYCVIKIGYRRLCVRQQHLSLSLFLWLSSSDFLLKRTGLGEIAEIMVTERWKIA